MAGLNLRSGFNVGGTYQPMTPAAANTTTAGGVVGGPQSISQMAYGINGTGGQRLDGTGAYGAVGAGIVATALLLFLWWSLPR